MDPLLSDPDLDGLPSAWETRVGLDPEVDDAGEDKDGDGLSNELERELGTNPSRRDSDGDTLSDREELLAGADGFLTDPLLADSDGDGVEDDADGSPNDVTRSDPAAPFAEPAVAIDSGRVVLGDDQDIAGINVSNDGAGDLAYAVQVEDPGLLVVSPAAGESRPAPGVVMVKLRPGVSLEGPFSTYVHVVDASGRSPDRRTIEIVSPVPEPAASLLAAAALGALALARRWSRRPDTGSGRLRATHACSSRRLPCGARNLHPSRLLS